MRQVSPVRGLRPVRSVWLQAKKSTEALQREPFTGLQCVRENALPGVHNLNGLGLDQGEAFG